MATLGEVVLQADRFALSNADGVTWGSAHSTSIFGQTEIPIPLGGNRLLVLYIRRYGSQTIKMSLFTLSETDWAIHFDDFLSDARGERKLPPRPGKGLDD